MVINVHNYLFFLVAAFTICVLPGPDMLFVIGNGLSRGVRGGIIASLGMSAGMLVHTLLVTFGLSAIFKESPLAFRIVQIIGGIYLVWIGYNTLREANNVDLSTSHSNNSLFEVFKRAALTNIFNPKVAIFFLAFLPQFVDQRMGRISLQLFAFGVSFLILGLAVDCAVGTVSGTVSAVLKQRSGAVRGLSIVSGLIFLGLGARILWSAV